MSADQPDVERTLELRSAGWRVAVHNDYDQDGAHHTFWLFTRPITKGDRLLFGVIGEATTICEECAGVGGHTYHDAEGYPLGEACDSCGGSGLGTDEH